MRLLLLLLRLRERDCSRLEDTNVCLLLIYIYDWKSCIWETIDERKRTGIDTDTPIFGSLFFLTYIVFYFIVL